MTIETCAVCHRPAHASETNDDGVCASCMRAAGMDPILPDAEECETCGGDGEVFEDRADGRGEHYTVQHACPDCDGAGRVTDDGPDFDPEDRPLPTEDTTGLKESPL